MKQFLLLYFLFITFPIIAQTPIFKVDCGNDTVVCSGLYADTLFHIGSKVKIFNGTPPITYKWSCKYLHIKYIQTASTCLNDTSILNPYVKRPITDNNKYITFHLQVTDKNNNVAEDSIRLRSSSYIYSLVQGLFTIRMGDSMQFNYDHWVSGGIPPVKYFWTPSIWLDDSTKIDAWCKPHTRTDYSQYIIDSAGCKSIPNLVYYIDVLSTSIKNYTENADSRLDLQQNGEQLTFNNPLNKLTYLSFYSIDGKKKYTAKTNDSFFDMQFVLRNFSVKICVVSIGRMIDTLKIY